MKLTIAAGILIGIQVANINLTFGDEKHNLRTKSAIGKAIRVVQASATEYLKHRECFSCHHQAMPIIALTYVAKHKFEVDRAVVAKQVEHTLAHFKKNKQKYVQGQGTGGQVDTAGYGLWALHAGSVTGNEWTQAVVDYLALRDKNRNFWRRSSDRPPSEASHFTATFVALKAVENYGTPKQKNEFNGKLSRVAKWWSSTRAKDTEDLVFKILLGENLELEKTKIQPLADKLLSLQKKDGGWSQNNELKSDAYATATALYSLYESNYLKASDPEFRRGLNYLLDNQKSDGSWHVPSRSSPFQEYFESGFPHKKDQFISITATCWAMMVLSVPVP